MYKNEETVKVLYSAEAKIIPYKIQQVAVSATLQMSLPLLLKRVRFKGKCVAYIC